MKDRLSGKDVVFKFLVNIMNWYKMYLIFYVGVMFVKWIVFKIRMFVLDDWVCNVFSMK